MPKIAVEWDIKRKGIFVQEEILLGKVGAVMPSETMTVTGPLFLEFVREWMPSWS